MIKLKTLLKENIKGKLTVYHGTREPFKTFNIKNSVQGIVWFTNNKNKIINGEAGANGKGYIITAEITLNNPAGWDEYDKLSLAELKRDGYDGAILPDDGEGTFDCFVFSNKQIKIKGIEKDEPYKKLNELTDAEREEMYPTDSDKWDDWQEYVDHFDYELERSELSKLVKRFDISYDTYFDEKIVKLTDGKNIAWFSYDKDNETFDYIKDINYWLFNSVPEQLLSVDVDDIYSGHLETTLKEFKENPSPVYHYTTEEKWNLIKQTGKIIGSSGTGINNKYTHGIFTSVNPEEYQDGSYGNVCLELNLPAFKTEMGLSVLNVEYEPEIEEYMIREYVSSVLELGELHDSYPSDMSPYTLIIGHTISVKFIKQI